MSDKINQIDTRSLKRAARKLLKQFNMNLNDFPNLAAQEKLTFLKTLFVRKYLEGQETDDQSWKEQIKVSSMNTADAHSLNAQKLIQHAPLGIIYNFAQNAAIPLGINRRSSWITSTSRRSSGRLQRCRCCRVLDARLSIGGWRYPGASEIIHRVLSYGHRQAHSFSISGSDSSWRETTRRCSDTVDSSLVDETGRTVLLSTNGCFDGYHLYWTWFRGGSLSSSIRSS